MTFRDWQDTEASDPLILPIKGKQYRIPQLGHLDEIRIREEQALIRAGQMPTMGNDEFLTMVLGDQLEQMRADNVPARAIIHAATVAHTDAHQGREAAEKMWEKGPDPEALAASIAALTAALKAAQDASTTSPDTASAESSTKKPASTRPTKSRPAKAAQPSRGRGSSRTRRSSPPTS